MISTIYAHSTISSTCDSYYCGSHYTSRILCNGFQEPLFFTELPYYRQIWTFTSAIQKIRKFSGPRFRSNPTTRPIYTQPPEMNRIRDFATSLRSIVDITTRPHRPEYKWEILSGLCPCCVFSDTPRVLDAHMHSGRVSEP